MYSSNPTKVKLKKDFQPTRNKKKYFPVRFWCTHQIQNAKLCSLRGPFYGIIQCNVIVAGRSLSTTQVFTGDIANDLLRYT